MNIDFLEKASVGGILKQIAFQARTNRLQLNMSQETLAERAGVSLGSVKRFELTGEISLKHLVKIAVLLDATDTFMELFLATKFQNIDQLLASKTKDQKLKQRANGRVRKG